MLVSGLDLSGYLLHYLTLRYTLFVFSVSIWIELLFRLVRRVFHSLIALPSTGSATSAAFLVETPHVNKIATLIFWVCVEQNANSQMLRRLANVVLLRSFSEYLVLITKLKALTLTIIDSYCQIYPININENYSKLQVDKFKN